MFASRGVVVCTALCPMILDNALTLFRKGRWGTVILCGTEERFSETRLAASVRPEPDNREDSTSCHALLINPWPSHIHP